jgi:hypothetical protein
MEVLKISATIDGEGHLLLDIPTHLPPGQVDLVLVVSSTTSPVTPPPYDFSDIAGKLTWLGDSVATQRSLRDEWS